MVYFEDHEKTVEDGALFTWTMKGRPDRHGGAANLCFALQLRFVRTYDGCNGVVLDQTGTRIPDAIKITALQPEDITMHKGQVVWLAGMNGLVVEFEGDIYLLFKVLKEDFDEGYHGKIYFYFFLPEQFGGGEIIYSEKQWLE